MLFIQISYASLFILIMCFCVCVSLAQFTGPETRSPHSVSTCLHAVQDRKEDPGGGFRLLHFQGCQGQRHHRCSTALGHNTPLPW